MFGKMHYDKGIKLYNSGDNVNSIEKMNKALQSGDLDDEEMYTAYVVSASCFTRIGNFDEALKVLNIALKSKSVDYRVYSVFSEIYFHQEKYEESLQYIEKTLELNSSDYLFWYNKGLTLFCLNRYDDSEKTLNIGTLSVSSINAGLISQVNHLLYLISLKKKYTIATGLMKNGKYEDAINVYDSIVERIDADTRNSADAKVIYEDSLRDRDMCLKAIGKNDSATDAFDKLKENTQKDTYSSLCPNCGSKVNPDDLFCGKCGKKLN